MRVWFFETGRAKVRKSGTMARESERFYDITDKVKKA
jgi:hypothetical protein